MEFQQFQTPPASKASQAPLGSEALALQALTSQVSQDRLELAQPTALLVASPLPAPLAVSPVESTI